MPITLYLLPVELIVSIMEELTLESLINLSYVSRRFYGIASDSTLNPWRKPIRRILRQNAHDIGWMHLRHLRERLIVPRQNWIDVLSIAPAQFILFDATLPNLTQDDWEICFRTRFMPGCAKWKRDMDWRTTYKLSLMRMWHRSRTSCTSDEAWTKYITLNKNGTANELEASSRNFNPLQIFNDMKIQSNLAHLQTHIRLVVEIADVRILAFGILNKPRGTLTINDNARALLHPPDIERAHFPSSDTALSESYWSATSEESVAFSMEQSTTKRAPHSYERMTRPLPTQAHENYPFYTPGGHDKRWFGSGHMEENGNYWVGPLMLTAQITGPHTREHFTDGPAFQDLDLTTGPGRGQYASLTWVDLDAIAPWMSERISLRIDGPGLGH